MGKVTNYHVSRFSLAAVVDTIKEYCPDKKTLAMLLIFCLAVWDDIDIIRESDEKSEEESAK
ncbi:MAG: hypothetical protein MJ108_09240 [Saccharofermentans sp.]|nr:hypothetical protein [Saccharofermentans sp.]